MRDERPEGWVVTTLGEICSHPQYGWTTSADKSGNGLKLLRTTDISSGVVDWSSVPACDEEPDTPGKYRLAPGDIVVSRAGSVGTSHVLGDCPPAVFASYLIRFRPLAGIPSEFVGLFLQSPSYWADVLEESAGIAVPNINASKLASLEFPLPPLAEQHRIVAKVKALLTEVDGARSRLGRASVILKRFRQAILSAACSGRLTADWRRENSREEDAEVLVGKLSQERKRLWKVRESAKMSAAGKQAKDDAWERRYKQPFLPGENSAEVLPSTWRPVTVSQVAFLDVGFAFKSSEFSNGGVKLLRGENLEPGRLRWSDTQYWPAEKLRGFEHLLVEEGEIILALDRPLISTGLKVARTTKTDLPCVLVQRMMRFKMVEPRLTTWLFYNLRVQDFTLHLTAGLTGSDLPHVTGTSVAEYTFGLPPIAELEEIVQRVEVLFALADHIEAQLADGEACVERLTSSLLAKAFRGELVPTEAELAREGGRDYEPASVLLERIRTDRGEENSSSGPSTRVERFEERVGARVAKGKHRRHL